MQFIPTIILEHVLRMWEEHTIFFVSSKIFKKFGVWVQRALRKGTFTVNQAESFVSLLSDFIAAAASLPFSK